MAASSTAPDEKKPIAMWISHFLLRTGAYVAVFIYFYRTLDHLESVDVEMI